MATDLLPAWPSYAFDHEPLNEGWRLDLPDGTLRSDFEQGPARQRQVFRNAPTTIYGQWAMTPAEFKMFKAFQNIVGGGQCKVGSGAVCGNVDAYPYPSSHRETVT